MGSVTDSTIFSLGQVTAILRAPWEEVPQSASAMTGLSPFWKPPRHRARGQDRDLKESPPQQGTAAQLPQRGEAGGGLAHQRGAAHLQSRPRPHTAPSLTPQRAGRAGLQLVEPGGQRKQETIKASGGVRSWAPQASRLGLCLTAPTQGFLGLLDGGVGTGATLREPHLLSVPPLEDHHASL